MTEQILFSGITPIQLSQMIVNGVREELGKIFNSKNNEKKQEEDEYYTIKEACKFLKCSPTKLWRLRKKGKFESYENGRGVLLKKSDLEYYIQSSNK
jgi:excisionase family DNA binding protein